MADDRAALEAIGRVLRKHRRTIQEWRERAVDRLKHDAGVPWRDADIATPDPLADLEAVAGRLESPAHPGAPEGERWWIIGQELMRGTGYHLTLTDKPWEGGEPVTLLRAPSPPDSEPGDG